MDQSARSCIYCKQPGPVAVDSPEAGKRELRPYGPNGADVCAECGLDPARAKQTAAELKKRIGNHKGPLIIDDNGLRPASRHDMRRAARAASKRH